MSLNHGSSYQLIGAALVCGFVGHALVSLGYSPSIRIHLSLVSWVEDSLDGIAVLRWIGAVEILLVVISVCGLCRKEIRLIGICYLVAVALVAGSLFAEKTGFLFGCTEVIRRVPWVCMLLFLGDEKWSLTSLLRIAVIAMFLSHGLASLSILGFNGMHVELASQLLNSGQAESAVRIAGYTDLVMAVGLAIPGLSRWVAYPACLWIAFIVVLSFGMAFPDGLFRLGFLLCALTLILEPKTHQSWFGS